jgi:uncharacterized protein (TIGR03435 family)
VRGAGLLILACGIAWAQPAFEVASVKPFYAAGGVRAGSGPSRVVISGNRVTTDGSLLGFVEAAYGLDAYQVSAAGVDGAVRSQVYNIDARAPGDGIPTRCAAR